MDSSAEAAIKARDAAELRFKANDIDGAHQMALEAQSLFPSLDGAKLLAAYHVHRSAAPAASKTNAGATDWLAVLGVDASSDREAIKKQFKKMCILVHPDKNSSVAADGAFKLVKEAYTFLSTEDSGDAAARQSAPPPQRSTPPPPPSAGETWDTPEIQRSRRCPRCGKKVRCCKNISVVECGECGLGMPWTGTANYTPYSTTSTQPSPPNPSMPSAPPMELRRWQVKCTHCSTGFHREVIASRGLLLHCKHCKKWFFFKVEDDGDMALYFLSPPAVEPSPPPPMSIVETCEYTYTC